MSLFNARCVIYIQIFLVQQSVEAFWCLILGTWKDVVWNCKYVCALNKWGERGKEVWGGNLTHCSWEGRLPASEAWTQCNWEVILRQQLQPLDWVFLCFSLSSSSCSEASQRYLPGARGWGRSLLATRLCILFLQGGVFLHVVAVCACRAAWFLSLLFGDGTGGSSVKCLLSTSGSAIKSQHPSSCAAAPCEIPAIPEASTREGCHVQQQRNMHLFLCSDLLSAEESLGGKVSCEIKCKKCSLKKWL